MCALIAMAVYSTPENGKDEYLEKTLQSLKETVDVSKHRIVLSVNAWTSETRRLLFLNEHFISQIIYNNTNIGTAEAINKAWRLRLPGESAVKMDDDVVIHSNDWLYLMEETIKRDPSIGQVGLKRRDLWENPKHENSFYRSYLEMLPHKPGERWIVVEHCSHIMGTCVLHSSALLDKIGFLKQPGVYGLDDSIASARSIIAGFKNVFLPHIHIDHIDPGGTAFTDWKCDYASTCFPEYNKLLSGYKDGSIPIYYNPFKKLFL